MITTHHLSVGYGTGSRRRTLIADTSVTLPPGLTALLGGNGRGKSSLMRTLAALQRPLEGSVTIGGVNIADLPPHRRARLIAIVTGSSHGAGGYTVEELVALGRYPYTGFFGRLGEADRRAVREAMELTGVSALRDRHVGSLSDGERQKTMIAKALAQSTPVVLLDEPTAYLDVASRLELLDILSRVARTEERCILMSTHDVGPVIPMADTLWMMIPQGEEATAESRLIVGEPQMMVAAGELDRLFPDAPVSFDPSRGDYRLVSRSGSPLS